MNIYLIGCEFSGKTTLAGKIITWQNEHMSGTRPGLHFHDHFTIPNTEMNAESRQWFVKAPPQIKEMYQRFMITYHMQPDAYQRPDWHHLGFFIEEAVYAPLYYGYGGQDNKAGFRSEEGQRTKMARQFEQDILRYAPNMVLVLLKADADVIRQRMAENKNRTGRDGVDLKAETNEPVRGVVKDKDVDYVLRRFEEEFKASLFKNKIILDTSCVTVEETFKEFLEKHDPFLLEKDRKRLCG